MRTNTMLRNPPSEWIVSLISLGIAGLGVAAAYIFGLAAGVVFAPVTATLGIAYLLMGAVPGGRTGQVTRLERPVLFWFFLGGIACCFIVSLGVVFQGRPPARGWTIVGVIVWILSPVWGIVERDLRLR